MVLATREALADLDMRIEGMIAEGDLVAVRLRATAKHVGEFLGYPATGRTITWTGMGWFRIEGGRLRERWNESDVYGIAEQLRE
jgi:predicted ester cyclase